jgi:hypothetical protein
MPVQESQSNPEHSTAAAQAQSPLNFEDYRTRVEPVFLKKREGGVRCYDCHSTLTTRLRLQPFLPGDSSWTEEQSRQNFAFVSQLVAPNDPLKSRLLLHPLAQQAGGDPAHAGGKFWKSQADPEWQMLAAWVRRSSSGTPATQPASLSASALDFHVFKAKIEPIFLKERPGHARCYGCHSVYNDVGAVKTNFSVHFFRSVFSSPIRIFFFLATKVRAVIVWRNSLSSTTHLFDPDPRRDHDYFFELPGFPGRQDAHSNERSQLRPRNDSGCPAWEPWMSCV